MVSRLLHQVLSFLPQDLQAVLANPPRLTDPASILRVLSLIFPFAKYVVVIVAFYIVWVTITGVMGMFSRFLRFALRIGPIFAIIAWIMANSGQGRLTDLMELAKQWTGLLPNGIQNNPGVAKVADLLGVGQGSRQSNTRRTRSSSHQSFSSKARKGGNTASSSSDDYLTTMYESAIGIADAARDGRLKDIVQGYVGKAITRASGLEWLHDWIQDDGKQKGGGRTSSR